MNIAASGLDTRQWRQVGLITLSAVAIFFTVRLLPTGTNLSHMDFRVDGRNSIEFCDPANPQFIPVVAVASPVTMQLRTGYAVVAGQITNFTLELHTAQGKPIAPPDLLVAHTKLLHLLITDPSLADYQHVHPEPTSRPGEWKFSFQPRFTGRYRVFADFTPVATARSLYANADVEVIPSRDETANIAPVQEVNASRKLAIQAGRLHFFTVSQRRPGSPRPTARPWLWCSARRWRAGGNGASDGRIRRTSWLSTKIAAVSPICIRWK